MKSALAKLLELLNKERVDVVEMLFHNAIGEGDEVWIYDRWCVWVSSHDERTLTHVWYKKNATDERRYHYTNHSGMFLVRVKQKF
ncbi:hypothetical protein [Escherichia coli]|uniref:hypothetical protein n=1 Tax=Escherichia coli TaxID=562 RepID=UPI001CA6BE4C|nr:hypothetical protein [Escherichia coli]QZY67687.1 hypothetical protein K7X33_16465 [Escherichia coli]